VTEFVFPNDDHRVCVAFLCRARACTRTNLAVAVALAPLARVDRYAQGRNLYAKVNRIVIGVVFAVADVPFALVAPPLFGQPLACVGSALAFSGKVIAT
jgi:hypothetical protein